jgi:hypothetical protein
MAKAITAPLPVPAFSDPRIVALCVKLGWDVRSGHDQRAKDAKDFMWFLLSSTNDGDSGGPVSTDHEHEPLGHIVQQMIYARIAHIEAAMLEYDMAASLEDEDDFEYEDDEEKRSQTLGVYGEATAGTMLTSMWLDNAFSRRLARDDFPEQVRASNLTVRKVIEFVLAGDHVRYSPDGSHILYGEKLKTLLAAIDATERA